MTILIASPTSGAGKTTITLALLAALTRRGLRLQSFKVGPDYIDPMFHTAVTGRPCRNLDPFLTSEAYVNRCFSTYTQGVEGAVIEGVMGLFDGKVNHALPDFASSAHVARILQIPVVLVIDAAKVGFSVAAIVYGLKYYDPRLVIAGVIFNRVGTPRHGEILSSALQSLGVKVLGMMYATPDITWPSRHLGLIPVEAGQAFSTFLENLATLAEQAFVWEELLPLIQDVRPTTPDPLWPDLEPLSTSLTLAVAKDPAFNFYYADNLDLLQSLGANLIYYSPLEQGLQPAEPVDGIYLGGGFPEIYAGQLAAVFQPHSLNLQIPIYAECGGLMVLGQSLTDLAGERYPMQGWFPFHCYMTQSLVLGYRQATSLRSTVSVTANQRIVGHEFHRSQLDRLPTDPIYTWESQQLEGWATSRIHASYLHVHWGEQIQLAQAWIQHCLDFKVHGRSKVCSQVSKSVSTSSDRSTGSGLV